MKSIKIIFTGYKFDDAKNIAEFFANKCAEKDVMIEGPSFIVYEPKNFEQQGCVFEFVEHEKSDPFYFSDALQYSYLDKFNMEMKERYNAGFRAGETIAEALKLASLAAIGAKSRIKENTELETEKEWKESRFKSVKTSILSKISVDQNVPVEWINEFNKLLSESNGK